jgi:hypothetical protein
MLEERNLDFFLNSISNAYLITDNKYNQLSEINLNNANCGTNGIEFLINGKFPNLKILKLQSNKLIDKSVILFKNDMFSNIIELDLGNNNIGDNGVANLDNCNLIHLTHLYIFNNNISNNGIKFLTSNNFKNLLELDLSYNSDINDNCLEIMKDVKFTNLKKLYLDYIPIDHKKIQGIKDFPFSNSIETISLSSQIDAMAYKNRKYNSNISLNISIYGYSEPNDEIYHYIQNKPKGTDLNKSSIGIDFYSKEIITKSNLKAKVRFVITFGQERFRTIQRNKGTNACLFNFSMDDKYSFLYIKQNVAKFFNAKIPFIFFAYKTKNCETIVKDKEIQNMIDIYGGKIFYFDDENKKEIGEGIHYLVEQVLFNLK